MSPPAVATDAPNYNQCISMLSAMFPDSTMASIRKIFSECGDFDQACDVLLNEKVLRDGLELDKAAEKYAGGAEDQTGEQFLTEAFPQVPVSVIAEYLTAEDNDTLKVYDILMNYELVKELSKDEPKLLQGSESHKKKEAGKKTARKPKNRQKLKKTARVIDISGANGTLSGPHPVTNAKTWDKIGQDVSTVCGMLGLSKQQVRPHYLKCHSVVKTVILVVENESLVQFLAPEAIKPRTRRVQNQGSSSTVRRTHKSRSSSPKIDPERDEREQLIRQILTASLDSDAEPGSDDDSSSSDDENSSLVARPMPVSSEVLQLLQNAVADAKSKDPELCKISDEFYLALIRFFQGDIVKIFEVCELILSCNLHKYTFPDLREVPATKEPVLDSHFSSLRVKTPPQTAAFRAKKPPARPQSPPVAAVTPHFTSQEYMSQVAEYQRKAASVSDPRVKQHYNSMGSQTRTMAVKERELESLALGRSRITSALHSCVLDLHNLTVKAGLATTAEVIGIWWSEQQEMVLAETFASRKRVKSTTPFKVITGRGIHSAGGTSKMRIAVKNWLQTNRFIFDEDSSYFIVTGKLLG